MGKPSKPEAAYATAAGLMLVIFMVGKMVGLESFTLGITPFEFKAVAIMLPFAMVLRRYGVVGIGAGCPLAHLLATGNAVNAAFAFAAASVGSVSSYLVYKNYRSPLAIFGGTVLISLSWTVIFGTYFSIASQIPIIAGFWDTLSSLWIGVNVVGFLFVALAGRASRSWDTPYAAD